MCCKISNCRLCGSGNLITVLSLGEQYLTGVFPKTSHEHLTKGPLELVWCSECGLLQLKHSYDSNELYGDNYGYRSGLNSSMIAHLAGKVQTLERMIQLQEEDFVIDIGSNDATLLKSYSGKHHKVGIDPTGKKFVSYYPEDVSLIPDFFSADLFDTKFPNKKAKIITSIAMFYDLEDPIRFVKDIRSVLADDGIWHFEQSYMPSMLRTTSYDTICHEHLEYYSFQVVETILELCGLRVIDVQMNAVNGGSFAVTACKRKAPYRSNLPIINWMLNQEGDLRLNTPKPYRDFEEKVYRHRQNLIDLIDAIVRDGKKIFGYGASTKGNVLLQFCGLTSEMISCIAEINEQKFGCFTPGTEIPIVSEDEAHAMSPDYYLVLPWHFKHNILQREKAFRDRGGKFIFPFPQIEIV